LSAPNLRRNRVAMKVVMLYATMLASAMMTMAVGLSKAGIVPCHHHCPPRYPPLAGHDTAKLPCLALPATFENATCSRR
jgi:hypothetical protein